MKRWTGTVLLLSSMAISATNNHYTITNAITKKMTGYEFWGTTYYPDHLIISIEGKKVEPDISIQLPESAKTVMVRYDYSFAKGFRKGAKEMLFELSPDKKSYQLNFSWYKSDRITAEGAKLKEAKKVKYKA